MLSRLPIASAILVAILVVLLVSGTAVAGGLAGSEYAQNVDEENETVPHENPDEVGESGDADRVGSFLSAELSELLGDSSTEISEQQYEMGRSLVGEEYDDHLEKFIEVAGDIDQEETAESFEQAQEEQQSLAETSEEFDETMEAYEEAIEEGDEERARQLARELQELADEIGESTARIDELYRQLEEQTGGDFSEARESNADHGDRIRNEADTVREVEFLAATVNAETNQTNISFSNPAGVTGELRSEEGEPIDNATVELQAGADTVTVVTDADGSFQATYRPTLVSLTESTLSVEYIPELDAPYLSAETNVSIAITDQVETELTIADTTDTAAFNETVSATGSVTVSELDGVGDLPIRLSVNGDRLASETTTTNGEFEIASEVPKRIESGEATITAELVAENAAISPSSASRPLQVDPTETGLTIDVDTTDLDTVTVSGELRTDDGDPVADESVTITADGGQLGTIDTDAEGRYATQVALDDDRDAEEVTIVATFDGDGTNLNASVAERQVGLPVASAGGLSVLADDWFAIGLLTVVFAALLLGWLLKRGDESGTWAGIPAGLFARIPFINIPKREETDTLRGASETGANDVTNAQTDPSKVSPEDSLEQARSLLSDGHPGDAVVVAYSTLRGELAEETPADASDTHWEFYRRCRTADTADAESLRTLTEAYETVVFAPHTISSSSADDAVEAMSQTLESMRSV